MKVLASADLHGKQAVNLVDSDTVFVSHAPAFGVLDPGFGDAHIGSQALRDFLERHSCRVHLHGHSHAGFGRHDSHFNVASAGRKRAMIVDLATLEHQVVHEP
jgi:Icc-related predicted phosphoesterase